MGHKTASHKSPATELSRARSCMNMDRIFTAFFAVKSGLKRHRLRSGEI